MIRHEPTIRVVFDGDPVFVPIEGTDLGHVLNTPSLLFRQVKTGWSTLFGWAYWIRTRDVLRGAGCRRTRIQRAPRRAAETGLPVAELAHPPDSAASEN